VSERVLPGARYTPRCLQRINDDRRGFTLLTPLLLAGSDSTLYVRDLHERDTLLLAKYPDREVFLLRPADSASGSVPHFERVRRDSILQVARGLRWEHPKTSDVRRQVSDVRASQ
jgi:hypothetical protein